ncbi:MAG: lipoprotein-releasing ABC transporter permease subunit [Thalassobaculaceae bacterium]
MAFGAVERLIALRYLRARRQEGFISVIAGFSLLGIALGVATLIIVMAVMNGFRAELLGRILGLNGHAVVYGRAAPIVDFDRLAVKVAETPGVFAVLPQVEGQAMATVGGNAAGVLVRGLRASDLSAKAALAANLSAAAIDNFAAGGVLLGGRLARRLGVTVGDQFTLVSPTQQTTVLGTLPRAKSYRVAGVFNVGMYEYDNGFIFMPLAASQVFFRMRDGVTGLEVILADAKGTAAASAGIRAAVGESYRVVDWRQRNSSFFNALQVERNVMFLILTLIILVAAFNVISSLIMLVKDKGRGIAILRTMGASRGLVMRVFFLTGASVGVTGTLVGTALGLAFAANIESIRQAIEGMTGTELFAAEIYFLSKLPAEVDTGEVLAVVAMALGLSFLATIYPAWRAARLDPVEALRNE